MVFGSAEIADSKVDGELPMKPRMRDEQLARRVGAIDQRLVMRIAGLEAEANGTEWNRGDDFESIIHLYQRCKVLPQPNMFSNHVPQTFHTEVPNHHPEFERTKPAAELQ